MMNMANMQDKLVKHGWFRTTIRLATPVFYTDATSSVPKGDRDLKIDLGGNDKDTYDLITPTKRFSQPTKSRGNVGKTSIQDSLLKLGWFKKTDEAIVHGPQSNGNVDIVPEGASNLDLWLKNYHEGKLSETYKTTSSVGDDVVEILDQIRRKEETVLPGKRKQGMVDKEEFKKNLLSNGWYSTTDNLRVETNTPADVSSEVVGPASHVNTGIDIGPNDSRKLDDDTYGKPEGIEHILNMVSTKKRSSQPTKSRGNVGKTNIPDSLLKLGWFKKTDEAVVHSPQSNVKVDLVPEGASNLDLWLKNYHDGKLSATSETTSSVGDDVVEILDQIRSKEETVLPGKRKQGMVDKAEFQKNLLSNGWYSATDNLRVETNIPADVSSEGVVSATHVNTGIDIGPNDSRKLDDDTYDKPEGIKQILNMVSTKKRSSLPTKSRGKVAKAELQENLLVKGWYRLTPKSDEDTSTVSNSDCSQDENIVDLEGKSVDKKEIIINSEGKTVEKNESISGQEIKQGDAEVQPSQFSHKETTVDIHAKNNVNILLDGQRKRRHTSESKYEGKRSKKAKLNEKTINNLLQESWTMVNRSRYQVTLDKLPEREPAMACITDTLSKSSGIKIDMLARSVQSENGDIETNVTDLSYNTTSLRRFLRRSRKMLRRMFRCGRNEE